MKINNLTLASTVNKNKKIKQTQSFAVLESQEGLSEKCPCSLDVMTSLLGGGQHTGQLVLVVALWTRGHAVLHQNNSGRDETSDGQFQL